MNLLDKLKNYFLYADKYKTDSEAVIIACYFNPQNNPYRLEAFNKFYESIKHLNHRIVECVIGDAMPQLPVTPSIARVNTKDLLWHKEALLNGIIKTLPKKFKYVFWLDTDVLFTNNDWLIQGVEELKYNNIIQPFEYCIHLEEGETKPSFDVAFERKFVSNPAIRHQSIWRSFCANHRTTDFSDDTNYDKHGHVGFAWGARREILDSMPLYDKALIGGADHIIAHASAGQIGHSCLMKSFTEDIDAVNEWCEDFDLLINGKISYVKGDLYHLWHGDVAKRQYLKRVQEFTPKAKKITKKDENGLYVADQLEGDKYVNEYFDQREPKFPKVDTSFGKLYPHAQGLPSPTFDELMRERTERLYGPKDSKIEINKPKKEKSIGSPFTRPTKPTHPRPIDANISRQEYVEIPQDEFGIDLTDFVEAIIIEEVIDDIFSDPSTEFENGQNQETGFEDGFGGGGFSGGGSGGDWNEPTQDNNDTQDYTSSDNFS